MNRFVTVDCGGFCVHSPICLSYATFPCFETPRVHSTFPHFIGRVERKHADFTPQYAEGSFAHCSCWVLFLLFF